nr:putative ribonuclease H-like domain-containing protein [Tanacetum cinerariifolium]
MLKVAKVSNEPEQSLILPFEEVNADETLDKSLPKASNNVTVSPPSSQVVDTQPAEETIATADATKSLVASVLAEEQGNQLKPSDAEKGMILIGKSIDLSSQDQSMEKKADSYLKSMPDDDVSSKAADDVIDELIDLAKNATQNSFVDKPVPSDSLKLLQTKISSLSTRVKNLKSFIARPVGNKLEESMPSLVEETLKATLPDLLSDSLKTIMPQMIKELTKVLKPKMESSIQRQVRKAMNGVSGKLSYCEERLDKNDLRTKELVDLMNDMVYFLDSAQVFCKANAERGKGSNNQKIMKWQRLRGQSSEEDALVLKSGDKSSKISKQAPPVSQALILHASYDKALEKKILKDEPPFKKLKFIFPKPIIPSPTPLSSFIPPNIRPPVNFNILVEQFTDNLFNTTSSEYSPIPPRDERKGKGIATEENPLKDLIPLMDKMQEMQRLAFLKWRKKSHGRADSLSVTKIRYIINNSTKEASMQIIKDNDPLNLTVYENFVLKMLGFSEWLKVYALASKVTRKSNNVLLKNLKAKFQWVKTQAKNFRVPPPPELSAFRLSIAKMKRKRSSKIFKEVFTKEDIMIDGMHRNLVPPSGVVGSRGLDFQVYFLQTKDEAPEMINKFITQIQRNIRVQILKVRSDNGIEFKNKKLRSHYEKFGIVHQTSIARMPQQNSVVKRRNRTLVEASHTMLIFSKSREFLWSEAIATACFT